MVPAARLSRRSCAATGARRAWPAGARRGTPARGPPRPGRTQPVQGRHLGGHEDLVAGPLPHHPADDALALAVAAGGVDGGHPEVQGPVQGSDGLVLGGADPGGLADAPGAVADLRHGQSAASRFAMAHGAPPRLGGPAAGRRRRLRRPQAITRRRSRWLRRVNRLVRPHELAARLFPLRLHGDRKPSYQFCTAGSSNPPLCLEAP